MRKKQLKEEILKLKQELKEKDTTIINLALLVEPYAQNRKLLKITGIAWNRDVQQYVFYNETYKAIGSSIPYIYLSTIADDEFKLNLLSDNIERDFKELVDRLHLAREGNVIF